VVPYTGAALSYLITPAVIAAQDATDYTGSSTPARYTQLRFIKLEAWLANNTYNSASVPPLTVLDAFSDVLFQDVANPGVDYAHISYRPALTSRSTYLATTNTTTMATIEIAVADAQTGVVTVDVVVAFD
jgi:hypothetical protein